MRTIAALLLLAASCLVPPGCASAEKAAMPAGEYHEVMHNGRLYVLGSQASLDKVKAGQDLVYKITLTGAGPRGETVVIEADKEGSATEDRLKAEFLARHPQQ